MSKEYNFQIKIVGDFCIADTSFENAIDFIKENINDYVEDLEFIDLDEEEEA